MFSDLRNERATAWALSLAGYLPFVAIATALLLLGKTHPLQTVLVDAFRTYGAIILSFLGGVRWGLAMRTQPVPVKDIVFSVVPAIAAWFALFLTAPVSVAVLLLCFCTQGAWDSLSVQAGRAPQWYGQLRITLTLIVALAHGIVIAAIL
jgi:Protein of unknown function (DUF3429)